MQFPQFHTPSVLLKRFFKNNPEQLKSYVQVGLVAAKVVVTPLAAVLKHLIEVQGMDPNTEPGRRMREQFNEALNRTFQQFHDHDFDKDYDFSWLNKKFEQTRKDLEQLDLNKEDFRKMTDVGNLKATHALDVRQVSPSPLGRTSLRADLESGVPVTIDQSPVDELANLLGVQVNPIAPEPAEQARDFFFGHDTSKLELPNDRKLKDALEKLVMIAKDLEDEGATLDPKELFAKTEYLKKVRKDIEQYSEPARPLKKKGKVHRTKTGDTKAVKETPRKSPKPIQKSVNKTVNLDTPESRVDYRARLAAAQNLTNEMIKRGLCANSPDDIHAQVQEILKFSEEALRSLKNVVMRHPVVIETKDFDALKRLEDRAEQSDKAFKSNRGSFRRVPTKR